MSAHAHTRADAERNVRKRFTSCRMNRLGLISWTAYCGLDEIITQPYAQILSKKYNMLDVLLSENNQQKGGVMRPDMELKRSYSYQTRNKNNE